MEKYSRQSNIPVLFSLFLIVLFFVIFTSNLQSSSKKIFDLEESLNLLNGQLANSSSAISNLTSKAVESEPVLNPSWINESGYNVEERFLVPSGFEREKDNSSSFGYFLRNLSLKDHGSPVLLYNGREKANNIYEAVVDMDIGEKDLQQCADAVIRLRAEYLYQQKDYDNLHFNFTNGFQAEYSKWIEGYRIKVSGSRVSWEKAASKGDTYEIFRDFLETVFTYAGTLSLSSELEPVASFEDMEIGDILIQGGSPGHAVIVFDVAIDKKTGQKAYLLGQSYMPAQEIHILKNLNSKNSSPWYLVNDNDVIKTPEWTFSKKDLKRFKN